MKNERLLKSDSLKKKIETECRKSNKFEMTQEVNVERKTSTNENLNEKLKKIKK